MGWSINEAPTTTTYLGYLSLDLDRAIKHSKELGCSVDFIATLQNLKQQLPEKSAFPAWKEQHPTVWRQQLRAAMIQYRNVGHDWQFDATQQANLRKYCLANKLLREFCKPKMSATSSPTIANILLILFVVQFTSHHHLKSKL
jgi:predicted NACHT family NTPase